MLLLIWKNRSHLSDGLWNTSMGKWKTNSSFSILVSRLLICLKFIHFGESDWQLWTHVATLLNAMSQNIWALWTTFWASCQTTTHYKYVVFKIIVLILSSYTLKIRMNVLLSVYWFVGQSWSQSLGKKKCPLVYCHKNGLFGLSQIDGGRSPQNNFRSLPS